MGRSRAAYGLRLTGWMAFWGASPMLMKLISFWFGKVNNQVPGPYLDEIFHVRQAQVYCEGNFGQWDPKITTPPGLYLISWLFHQLHFSCDIETLRSVNAVILSLTLPAAIACRLILQRSLGNLTTLEPIGLADIGNILSHTHAAFNMCLFPPLFFFSALYYTDVASTFFTVLTFTSFAYFQASTGAPGNFLMVFWSIIALFFRQTNVFWVAVFPAGLSLVQLLKSKASGELDGSNNKLDLDLKDVILHSISGELTYDRPISNASIEDYVKVALSIGITAVLNGVKVVRQLMPFGAVLLAFLAFVMLNGGVVLGDKSNHVATIHLTQMLYIWPYIVFFSFPIIYATALASMLPANRLPRFLQTYAGANASRRLPRPLVFILVLLVAISIVHFNTIIHPFTLADNRHYVFYVFRLLRRNAAIKYLVAPIYLICGWATIQTMCAPDTATTARITTMSMKPSSPSTRSAAPVAQQQPTVSFALVWLATCTLSLATAPLVEPRYFILPWLMWRLHIPSATPSPSPQLETGNPTEESDSQGFMSALRTLLGYQDHRLWLETAWFLAVNAVTGYVFLYQGFEWPQEPGSVQRFMW